MTSETDTTFLEPELVQIICVLRTPATEYHYPTADKQYSHGGHAKPIDSRDFRAGNGGPARSGEIGAPSLRFGNVIPRVVGQDIPAVLLINDEGRCPLEPCCGYTIRVRVRLAVAAASEVCGEAAGQVHIRRWLDFS